MVPDYNPYPLPHPDDQLLQELFNGSQVPASPFPGASVPGSWLPPLSENAFPGCDGLDAPLSSPLHVNSSVPQPSSAAATTTTTTTSSSTAASGSLLPAPAMYPSVGKPSALAAAAAVSGRGHRRGESAPTNIYSPLASHAPKSLQREWAAHPPHPQQQQQHQHLQPHQLPANPLTKTLSIRPRHTSFSGPGPAPGPGHVSGPALDSAFSALSPSSPSVLPVKRPARRSKISSAASDYQSSPLLSCDPMDPWSPIYSTGFDTFSHPGSLLASDPGFPDANSAMSTPVLPSASAVLDPLYSPAFYSPANSASPLTPHMPVSTVPHDRTGGHASGFRPSKPSWMGAGAQQQQQRQHQQHQQSASTKNFVDAANHLLSSPLASWESISGSPSSHIVHPISANDNSNTKWLYEKNDDCGATGTELFNDASWRTPNVLDPDPGTIALFEDPDFDTAGAAELVKKDPCWTPPPSSNAKGHQRHKSQPANMPSFSEDRAATPIFELPWGIGLESSTPDTPDSSYSYPLLDPSVQMSPRPVRIKAEKVKPEKNEYDFGGTVPMMSPISPMISAGNAFGPIGAPNGAGGPGYGSELFHSQTCPVPQCDIKFESGEAYRNHLGFTHGTTPEQVKDFLKSLGLDEESIRERNGLGSGTVHRCMCPKKTNEAEECGSTFSRPYDLTRHLATVHAVRKSPWICNYCDPPQELSRHDAWSRHLTKSHPEMVESMGPGVLTVGKRRGRGRAGTTSRVVPG